MLLACQNCYVLLSESTVSDLPGTTGGVCPNCRKPFVALKCDIHEGKMIQVVQEVQEERVRQNVKWGEQNHHPIEWMAILGEEFGEVSKAACEAHFHYENGDTWADYRKELIQTAAVAVAMIECLDRNGEPK